jgi:hypothetical protein
LRMAREIPRFNAGKTTLSVRVTGVWVLRTSPTQIRIHRER